MSFPTQMLQDLGTIHTGSTPKTNDESLFGGDIPFVTPGDLGEITPIHTATRSLTEEGAKTGTLLPAGSVLVCCIGSLGKIGFAGRPLVTNQQINAIVFDGNKIDPRYGFFACRLLKPQLESMAPATTVPIVNKSRFSELNIPVPPLEEQRRIAAILDQAETLRTQRRTALALLDSLTQSLFLDMFGDDKTILTRWSVKNLGASLDFLTSGSRGWASYYAESGDLFLRIQNVRKDELSLEDVAYVKAPDTAEARRTLVQPGDVLLSITADLGRTAVVPDNIGQAFINQHLSILRTKALIPRFLSAYISSPIGQQQVMGRNKQGVKAGLNFDDIRSFQIPHPPLPLQQTFATRIASIEALKATHRRALAALDALFASLQQRAFAGQL